MEDSAPTVLSRPPARARSGPAGPDPTPATPPAAESSSPPTSLAAQALLSDEAQRMRRFLFVVLILGLGTGVTLPFQGGDRRIKLALLVAIVIVVAGCAAYYRAFRDERRYRPVRVVLPALLCIVGGTAGCQYFGVFSPAPMVFMMAIYVFGLGASQRVAFWIYLGCALPEGLGMVLVALGVLGDHGIFPATAASRADMLVGAALVQYGFASAFVLARLSSRGSARTLAELERATRQVSQREALLREVNQDLERALRAGRAGRWSGARLGRWRLGALVGRGAMGDVYEAREDEGERPAAVKVVHPDVERDPRALHLFLREADLMARVESPHVVRIYGAGDGSEHGEPPFMAMELLKGHDLGWHLRHAGPLGLEPTCELVRQVAAGLESARRQGIVHRDLKPPNVFRARVEGGREIWKVLDFGVSKLFGEGTLTQGHMVGTPGYMAPEQAQGDPVDHRADVFSLAAVAYRVLTGRPAFSGEDFSRIVFELCYQQPRRPSEWTPLPADVDLVLALGLAKRPEDRFESALALAAALEQALGRGLDPALRERARALLRKTPFGARVPG